jgi:5'(3')-deoxyribonucleotidase
MRGESWQSMIRSLDEHWEKFKSGKDFYGGEYNGSHIDMVIRKAQILQRWYKENPQGDDRPHRYLNVPKIGLDIDEVLAAWVEAWVARHGIDKEVTAWSFDRYMYQRFEEMKDDKQFWLDLRPLILPKDMPFEPHCYITARSIPQEWTEEWLFDVIGFPYAKVHSVGFGYSKVKVATEAEVDVFVDDSFKNFVELNNAGICTFLFDAPHNQKYDVGYRRIKHLKELVD